MPLRRISDRSAWWEKLTPTTNISAFIDQEVAREKEIVDSKREYEAALRARIEAKAKIIKEAKDKKDTRALVLYAKELERVRLAFVCALQF